MSGFQHQFENALLSIQSQKNKVEANQAETFLNESAQNSFSDFLIFLSEYMIGEANRESFRIQAGILLKNLVSSKNPKVSKTWMNDVTSDKNDSIKTNLQFGLASDNISVVKQFASCISAVCSQEFKLNSYQHILEILSQIAADKSQQEAFRQAAILTLSIIMEDVDTNDINSSYLNNIIVAIYENIMDNPNDPKIQTRILQAIKTLKFSLKGLGFLIQQGDVRENVLNMIYTAYSYEGFQFKLESLKCLTEYAKHYYIYLGDSIAKCYEITSQVIVSSNKPDLIIEAFEFWITISSNEKKLIKHNLLCNFFISSCEKELFNFCTSCIESTRDEDFQEEDTQFPYKSSIILLYNMSKCSSEVFIDLVLNKVTILIQSNDNTKIYIGLSIFSSICNTRYQNKIVNIFVSSLGSILQYIDSEIVLLRRTTIYIMISVAELYFERIGLDNIDSFLNILIKHLQVENDAINLGQLCLCAHCF